MQQSDEDRFAEFVRQHKTSLFRTAYLMTGDYQRAEDLLQSTLVRLYQRWSRVESMERPVGYARRVLINQVASWWHRRSSGEVPMLLLDDPGWGGGVDEVAEQARVWGAVLRLPPRQRAVIALRYYEDLSESEIAETLGMRPGTVKSHSHAALRRLARILGEPTAVSTQSIEEATS